MIAVGFSMAAAVLIAFATPSVAREMAMREMAHMLCADATVCRRDGLGYSALPASLPPTPIGMPLDRVWIPQPCRRTGDRMIC